MKTPTTFQAYLNKLIHFTTEADILNGWLQNQKLKRSHYREPLAKPGELVRVNPFLLS